MSEPLCPQCQEPLLVQQRSISLVRCTLEEDDPSRPCPGDEMVEDWYDETYHPHYHCQMCNQPYGFNMKPVPEFMVGRDDQSIWEQDDIQFCRLLAEIAAADATIWGKPDLMASMDVSDVELAEIFKRALARFERIKESINDRLLYGPRPHSRT